MCASLCIHVVDGRPSLVELYNHVIKEAAVKWRDIGVQLIDSNDLDTIEADHPQDVEKCCKRMLEKWLKTTNATWNKLINALRTPCVALTYLADRIEHKLITKEKSKSCKFKISIAIKMNT